MKPTVRAINVDGCSREEKIAALTLLATAHGVGYYEANTAAEYVDHPNKRQYQEGYSLSGRYICGHCVKTDHLHWNENRQEILEGLFPTEDKLELKLTLNGKTVSPLEFSKESWENLRKKG